MADRDHLHWDLYWEGCSGDASYLEACVLNTAGLSTTQRNYLGPACTSSKLTAPVQKSPYKYLKPIAL